MLFTWVSDVQRLDRDSLLVRERPSLVPALSSPAPGALEDAHESASEETLLLLLLLVVLLLLPIRGAPAGRGNRY